ncbi:putative cyclase [Kribbella steppae]|uniref:Putative cyclase n=1 Tax=Kribbella steppae TaxID=2512223 RepID=A0A4R2H385_9ACTN|nr:cyclase family protein [Kribbella steppae]TCO19616.1 putative cyclase [Kribbella steppae]
MLTSSERPSSVDATSLPTYAQLLERQDGRPPGSSWGVFGPDDHLGSLNLLGQDQARVAAGLVRHGAAFNLDYEANAFTPPVSPNRRPAQHTMFSRHDGCVRDDRLDSYYLQVSSQIDGLRHHRHPVHGFYGGVSDEEVAVGSPALGIQHAAAKGVVGRGVLLDVARHLTATGRPLNLRRAEAISTKTLDDVAAAQDVELRPGDILLIHTGWARHAIEDLTADERTALSSTRQFCGLEQSRDTLAWIWDHHLSMVASDTVAIEVMPSVPDSPFHGNVGRMMHPDLIALLGIHLGELWRLHELADDCAADGVYEFLLTAKPLNILGGVGSPPNALAIK